MSCKSLLRYYVCGAASHFFFMCISTLAPNTFFFFSLQSFHYCKYRRDENQLYVFADDSVPRWLTASYHVDFDTMAGADKFGNIYFVRLPQDVSNEFEDDLTGEMIKLEPGKLNGAPNKLDEIAQFHVGDVVTCLQKASLVPEGMESITYGTTMGSLGALRAFSSWDDVYFFSHLEMHEAGKPTFMRKRPHGL